MELYPAIDLRDGRCVRLHQGRFAAETVYDHDPVGVAKRFAEAGVGWIHVVDLDAARTGELANTGIVEAICAAVPCRVQVGGGVRNAEAAGALLSAGAARVVVGTAAVEQPQLVADLCALHPGAIAVGLDAHGRELAVRGWARTGAGDLVDVAQRAEAAGVSALVVTEIGRDGTLAGPGVDGLTAVLAATTVAVVGSGGVGSLDDLRALDAVNVDGRRPAGVIVGTALYDGRFGVGQALEALRPT